MAGNLDVIELCPVAYTLALCDFAPFVRCPGFDINAVALLQNIRLAIDFKSECAFGDDAELVGIMPP